MNLITECTSSICYLYKIYLFIVCSPSSFLPSFPPSFPPLPPSLSPSLLHLIMKRIKHNTFVLYQKDVNHLLLITMWIKVPSCSMTLCTPSDPGIRRGVKFSCSVMFLHYLLGWNLSLLPSWYYTGSSHLMTHLL